MIARGIAGGVGLGRAPLAPGTVASALAALFGAGLLLLSPWLLLAAAVLAGIAGVWAIHACNAGGDDPGWVVIDEIAGQWLTLLGLAAAPVSGRGVIAAFLLFRVLDIAKPGPIGWADRRHGAVAVMADDVIAGLIGAALLAGVQKLFPALLDG